TYVDYGSQPGIAQPKPASANLTHSNNSGHNDLNNPRFLHQRVATPITQAVHGLAVTAVNQDHLQGVGVGGGISGNVAVNLSGAVGVVSNPTDAYVAAGAKVNARSSGAEGQSVLVAAGNDLSFLGIAAALSVSGVASITPGVVVLTVSN